MPTLLATLEGLFEQNGDYFAVPTDDWSQGRSLYGGMTTALCATVAARSVPTLPPLRSAQVCFVGPAAGELQFTARLLRRGKYTAIVGVDCMAEPGMAAHVLFAYGADRDSRLFHDVTTAPNMDSPETCEPFFPAGVSTPDYVRHFEMRQAFGQRLESGGGCPEFGVWVRQHDVAGVDPAIALLAIGDSLPPAAMVQSKGPAPVSTITWTMDLLQPATRTDWHLLRSRSEQSTGGYSLQAMEIWDERRRRVAVGRQVVAVFA